MNILGIDLSINSPGLVILNCNKPITNIENYYVGTTSINKYNKNKHYFLLKDNKNNKTISTLSRIISTRNIITQLINKYQIKYVALEGYSFASSGRSIYQIGELHGIIKCRLYELNIPFLIIEPSSVKIAACGKGNAKKSMVIEGIKKEYNIDFKELDKIDDLYDAYIICALLWTKLNYTYLNKNNIKIQENMLRALTKKAPNREPLIESQFIKQGD